MEKIIFDPKHPPDELHIKDVGTFFIVNKNAYYADGRPVEPGKLWICQHCKQSPPFIAWKEIEFAKHMVQVHPEHATVKVEKAVEKIVKIAKKAPPKKITKKKKKKKKK